MKIIGSRNVNDIETRYLMTMNPEIMRMRDVEGETIEFVSWLRYQPDEASSSVLSILTPDGQVYATNSQTFIQAFEDIESLFALEENETFHMLKVIGGTSKAGRHYITCMYVK